MKEVSFALSVFARIACLSGLFLSLFLVEPVSAQLRSDDSSARQVWVRFENTFPNPVNLIWLDFNGDEHSFQWLDAGKKHRQQTSEHHAWLFRNREGRVVGSYAATGAAEQKCRIGIPVPWVGPRPGAVWISDRGGRFVNAGEGRWTYFSVRGTAVYHFQEEDRTWEFVTLFDPARGERVRLLSKKLLVRHRGDRQWTLDTGGSWGEGDEPTAPSSAGPAPGTPGVPRPDLPPPAAGTPMLPDRPAAAPGFDYTPPPAPGSSGAKPASSVPAAPPAPATSPRSRWDGNDGVIYQKVGEKKWTKNPGREAATHWFEEHEVSERFVALYDRERDLWVRLYEDRVLLFSSEKSKWEVLEKGGWTK